MQYQPTWKDGKEVGAGQRDCAGRYSAIAKELEGHHGFTVLDLGAYAGYFSLRLVQDFNAVAIAVDPYKSLRTTVEQVNDPRLMGIYRRLTVDQVRALGKFDVILCLSFLHHVRSWQPMLQAVVDNSQVAFIETPMPEEVLPTAVSHCPELAREVWALNGKAIAWTPGYKSNIKRPLYCLGELRR